VDERSPGLILRKEGGVARLVISRPARMNVLRPADLRLLWQHMVALEAEEAVRLVVLEGEGDKAFCAGLDLSGWRGVGLAEMRRRAREARMVVNRLADLALPTVALVKGVAAGLGLELCLACDFVLAEEGARFGFPEVRLGLIPWMGGVRRLIGAVGDRRAAELIFTGGMVEAETAQAWGLVNEVVPRGGLEKALLALADRLIAGSKAAQAAAKRAFRASRGGAQAHDVDYELELLTYCLALGDAPTRIAGLAERVGGEGVKDPEGRSQEGD